MTVTFELQVNGQPITKVSVINKGRATSTDNRDDWYVYEWNAWRSDAPVMPDPSSPWGIKHYAAGELMHCQSDGIEMLAIKVLTEYRELMHPERDRASEL